MSVSPELIFELLLKVPNHSELFLFELKSKFDWVKRDVIAEIQTQELGNLSIKQSNYVFQQIISPCK